MTLRQRVHVYCDKRVAPEEFVRLMVAAGWGDEASYDLVPVRRSIEGYPFVAHARADDGFLVGYISAFSDGAFAVLIGELVVHPEFRRHGVGSRLLRAVELQYAGVPVYVNPFVDQQAFFERNGYSLPRRSMTVLFKSNTHPTDRDIEEHRTNSS